MINKLFPYILIFCLFFTCTNPIEKKRKELENCKLTVNATEIIRFQFILFPPVPKIHFKLFLDIENTNDDEVTIQKFNFNVLKEFQDKKFPLQVARISSSDEIIIPAKSKRELVLELITILEENQDKDLMKFALSLGNAAFNHQEIEFTLDGMIEFKTLVGIINIPYKNNFKTKL